MLLSSWDFYYQCIHNHYQDEALRKCFPTKLLNNTFNENQFSTKNRKPIRIKLEYIFLNETSNNKKFVLRQTFRNVKKFLSSIINVTTYQKTITAKEEYKALKKNYPNNFTNYDLVITVLCNYFPKSNKNRKDESLLAKAHSFELNQNKNDLNRPIQGEISININTIPDYPQGENSLIRYYFGTLLHETMHILGFSHSLYYKWINKEKGIPYENPITIYHNKKYGITQQFISTPKLTKWVNQRFQVYDPILSKLGLELEDGGGEGTSSSHPNSRLYFTDVMQGKSHLINYFSGIMFNLLEDTGWYTVNFTKEEELIYMNNKYNKYISQNVMVNPPRISFPKDYLCDSDKSYCFYDYSSKASCTLKKVNELSEEEGWKDNMKNIKWYYDQNQKFLGVDELRDFAPVLAPTDHCKDENVSFKKSFETFGESSVCAMSTFYGNFKEFFYDISPSCFKARCGTDGNLRLIFENDVEYLCTRKNKKIYQKGRIGYALCPDPKIACANLNKTKMINIHHVIPDRGSIHGNNYITIIGEKLNTYKNLKILLGKYIKIEIVDIQKNFILAKIPALLNDKNVKKLIPYNLHVTADNEPDTTIESFYTFVD